MSHSRKNLQFPGIEYNDLRSYDRGPQMNPMSPVFIHSPHLALFLSLSLVYTSLSIYISFCFGKLLSRTQITLPPLLFLCTWKQFIHSSLVISCQHCWSFPQQALSIFPYLCQWNLLLKTLWCFSFRVVFSFSHYPHSLLSAPMVMCTQKSPWISWFCPLSCLRTMTADILSPAVTVRGLKSHKLSSKVINGTGNLFVSLSYTVPITEQRNCLPVSP